MMKRKQVGTRPPVKLALRRRVTKRRLQLLVAGFLIGVTIPLYLLFHRVYTQLRQESLYQYRLSAESTLRLIDDEMARLIAIEETRPVGHYGFFSVEEQQLLQTKGLTLSPLSKLPVSTHLPGLIGYFQLNADGQLSSPVLPDITEAQFDASGLPFGKAEYLKRLALRNRLEAVLTDNRLLHSVPSAKSKSGEAPADEEADKAERVSSERAPAVPPASVQPAPALDDVASAPNEQGTYKNMRLRSNFQGPKLDVLNLDTRLYQKQHVPHPEAESRADSMMSRESGARSRLQRKEKVELPKSQSLDVYRDFVGRQQSDVPPQLLSFEGEIDPLQLYVLQDATFLLVRKVWRAQQRLIQGFLVDGRAFLKAVLTPRFHPSRIGTAGRLVVSYRGELLEQIQPSSVAYGKLLLSRARPEAAIPDSPATLIYQHRFVSPFNDLTVQVAVPSLPLGPGAMVVHVLASLMAVVLGAGVWGLYRLASQQIELATAQQNFVSAVSHELKTPLTSIRMYGELLRSGWVPDEAKRQTYYDFIFFESERLSRLVANVLELATLTKQDVPLQLHVHDPVILFERLAAKVVSQVEAAGFTLEVVNLLPSEGEAAWQIEADEDAVARILINLVDNAIKFSAEAETKTVRLELSHREGSKPSVSFSVRDYGPGIDRREQAKMFQLFYRAGSELTRTTPGTGIGLALVSELAQKMRAEIDFQNRTPGAEFQVHFPAGRDPAH